VAIAYLRASTDKQELGLDTQRAAIESWAAAQSVRVAVFEVDEAVSGGTPLEERAGLQRAIAQLRKFNAGLLLVAKRDRLARDVVIAAMVERAVAREGAQLFSVDGIGNGDAPVDALMRTMVDGVAQFEKAIIRKRITDALALKKTRLERVGGIPWGFRLSSDGKHLEPEPDERETTRIVRQLVQNGLQYRKIVRALAEAGRFNRRGKIFGIKQISLMVAGASSGSPRSPEPVAACGRGHVHEEGEDAIGAFCKEGECGLEAGKPLPIRRIDWRSIARAS
jgi:DNA invertase Pin-like site-specific DNA recombinase